MDKKSSHSMYALRSFLTPVEPNMSIYIILAVGLCIFHFVLGFGTGNFFFFVIGVVGPCLIFSMAEGSMKDYRKKICRVDQEIRRAAAIFGESILEEDFAGATRIDAAVKLGRKFLYYGSGPRIYYIAEVESAKVESTHNGEDTDYEIWLYTVNGGCRIHLGPQTIHRALNPTEYSRAAAEINQWIASYKKNG